MTSTALWYWVVNWGQNVLHVYIMTNLHHFTIKWRWFMKYLSNIHTNYKAESTRKTDTTRFSIYRMSQMVFEVTVGKLIFCKKEKEKRSSKTHILLLILSIRKTKLVFWEQYGPSKQWKFFSESDCFAVQRYKGVNIFAKIRQYFCIFYFSLSPMRK